MENEHGFPNCSALKSEKLTKREKIAAMVIQGLCSNADYTNSLEKERPHNGKNANDAVVDRAISITHKLLKQLEK